jgi:Flp pilus assembly protein protease CpaA
METTNIIAILNVFVFFIISLIDIKILKIHNISILILFLYGALFNIYMDKTSDELIYYLIICAFLIFIGFLFFVAGIWGAGDAKLITVSILFVELNNVALMIMASFIFCALFGFFYIFCKNDFSLKGILSFYKESKIPFAPGVFLAMVTTNFLY